jgi:asparagine synthase (glutamine-hydrolysing)
MCGIAGFFGGYWHSEQAANERVLRAMADAIEHRGPDSDGYWIDPAQRVAFAHRRLAIVDLTPTGAQPMVSASGRYVISYNGEIYNHQQIRARLNEPWRGTSDTETLLAAIEAWGLRAALEATVGMFAIALWDRQERTLFLARDRFGEKPLYYGWEGGLPGDSRATLLFGSELAALRAHTSSTPRIDAGALRGFMRYNCVAGTDCIYENMHKLAPGCFLTYRLGEAAVRIDTYWSTAAEAGAAHASPFRGSVSEAVDTLEHMIRQSIAGQMVADVPVGAFLSGGVDSSTIVALMQAQASRPVRTFTIGFDDSQFNEAHHARAIAQHLRTDHTELYVSPADALELVPRLPTIYSEPFADSSQIPTHLLSRLARGHVTVSLSGDCGDELFAGYNRHLLAAGAWRRLSHVPLSVRRGGALLLNALPARHWEWLGERLGRGSSAGRFARLADKINKLALALGSRDVEDLYRSLVSHWPDPGRVVIRGDERSPIPADTVGHLAGLNPVERMMVIDVLSYMNDDILTKLDRAAMAISLEGRVPFLDHRLARFAWSLPLGLKIREGTSKWILRQVLYRHVPRALVERPKAGFIVPVDRWLRGPLRDWAEHLLSEVSLGVHGLLHVAPIRECWQRHLSGARNEQARLWPVLMFQAWFEVQRMNSAQARAISASAGVVDGANPNFVGRR